MVFPMSMIAGLEFGGSDGVLVLPSGSLRLKVIIILSKIHSPRLQMQERVLWLRRTQGTS